MTDKKVKGIINLSQPTSTVLLKVRGLLSTLPPPTPHIIHSIYNVVLQHLGTIIDKLIHLNLQSWDSIYNDLHALAAHSSQFANLHPLHGLFTALNTSILWGIGSRGDWNAAEGDKDRVLKNLLYQIGAALARLPHDYYEIFLPHGSNQIMAGIIQELLSLNVVQSEAYK